MPASTEVAGPTIAATRDAAPRLVPLETVLDHVSVSKTKLYKMIRAGRFPEPAKLGRSARWLSSDVDAFVLRVAAAGKLPPPARGRAAA